MVLATSTDINEEDAGTLIKCTLEQLRFSSDQARQFTNMRRAQGLPRGPTKGLHGWLLKGQYEDLPTDALPDEDKTDDSSAAWAHETRQVKRKSHRFFF